MSDPSDPISRLKAALEGRYHIEREIGEGGMATVYLAEDLRHERKVALKVLKPELAAVVGAERNTHRECPVRDLPSEVDADRGGGAMCTWRARELVSWCLGIAVLSLTGCGKASPTVGGDGGDDGGGMDPVVTTQVAVNDDFFSPTEIAVSPGATVVWSWVGSDFHDVTWSSAQLPDSPLQSGGMHEVAMPNTTGEYAYYCTDPWLAFLWHERKCLGPLGAYSRLHAGKEGGISAESSCLAVTSA